MTKLVEYFVQIMPIIFLKVIFYVYICHEHFL
ncbi:hypothetical protein M2480_003063 [Parabacteroides sp. PFB2-12]|nr:hypothetical protein [Parabacteroides sp. PM6-13]MDH6392057.1 hypothetical protein [Parabacteroides sp. PFB2-12]